MNIRLGAKVLSADDEHMGEVSRILVNVRERRIGGVVVHHGVFVTHEYRVNSADVARWEPDRVYLSRTADEVKQSVEFLKETYPEAAGDWTPALFGAEPIIAGIPGQLTVPAMAITEEKDLPPDTIDLSRTTLVQFESGEDGGVDGVDFADASGDLLEVFVRQGLILTHDVTVAASRVRELTADIVHVIGSPHDQGADETPAGATD